MTSMLTILRRALPLLLALLASASVHAGKIILYDYENFGGRSLAATGPMPNLADVRFNDRVMSIVVQSGVWELCADANFRGGCARLGPGQYPTLGGDMRESVSSLREIQARHDDRREEWREEWREERREERHYHGDRGRYEPRPFPQRGAPRLILFSREELRGRSVGIEYSEGNLERVGFNNRVESLRVEGSPWELCTRRFFRGECIVLEPGEYMSLPGSLRGEISSARPVETRYR